MQHFNLAVLGQSPSNRAPGSSVGRAPGSSVGRAPYPRSTVEVRGSKPELGTWWWGRIPPGQPYPKGAAPAATTLLAER